MVFCHVTFSAERTAESTIAIQKLFLNTCEYWSGVIWDRPIAKKERKLDKNVWIKLIICSLIYIIFMFRLLMSSANYTTNSKNPHSWDGDFGLCLSYNLSIALQVYHKKHPLLRRWKEFLAISSGITTKVSQKEA